MFPSMLFFSIFLFEMLLVECVVDFQDVGNRQLVGAVLKARAALAAKEHAFHRLLAEIYRDRGRHPGGDDGILPSFT